MASTRVSADFRVFIWGTVAAGIAALLVPVLAAVSNFHRPTRLRRSLGDSTACLEKGADIEQMTEALHVTAAIRGGASLVHGVQMLEHARHAGMAG